MSADAQWPAEVAPTLRVCNGTPFMGGQDIFSNEEVEGSCADANGFNFDMFDIQYGVSPCLGAQRARDTIVWWM